MDEISSIELQSVSKLDRVGVLTWVAISCVACGDILVTGPQGKYLECPSCGHRVSWHVVRAIRRNFSA